MRTDYSMRPAGALATVAIPIPDRATAESAVRTELPPRQTVTPTAAVDAKQAPALAARAVTQQVVIDSAAAAIVYQDVDQRTSQVVKQYPEQATLRRRAYLRELEARQAAETAQRTEHDLRPNFESTV
jgi:hypothetical protein